MAVSPHVSPAQPVATPWPVPRSLYVHVPFCRHRCGYCNFSVVTGRDDLFDAMTDALIDELRQIDPADRPGDVPLDTIFLGGGTPTRLPGTALRKLSAAIREAFPVSPGVEWSVEANPEDITPAVLDVLTDMGVNRISLGVQSFDAGKLEVLQRGHSRDSAIAAITDAANRIGNVSIDLIFATPGETVTLWQDDVTVAAELPITHVSTYALTIEKGTTFWNRAHRGSLARSDESTELAMIAVAATRLGDAELHQYEISNFARTGYRCRHNQAYWAGAGWHAVGPGAARFVGGRREVNHRSPTTYLRRMRDHQSPTAESETITRETAARERAAFGVRQLDGIDLDVIATDTGIDVHQLLDRSLSAMAEHGLITMTRSHVRLTAKGLLLADGVAASLLSD